MFAGSLKGSSFYDQMVNKRVHLDPQEVYFQTCRKAVCVLFIKDMLKQRGSVPVWAGGIFQVCRCSPAAVMTEKWQIKSYDREMANQMF